MVSQTNLYAQQFLSSHPTSFYSRENQWYPVDHTEIKKYWGLLLNMGLVKKNKKKATIRSYWSIDVLYATPMYRAVMKRLEAILRFIHYCDNSQCPPASDPSHDRIYKIRPLISHFNSKFAEAYTPEKKSCCWQISGIIQGEAKILAVSAQQEGQIRHKSFYNLCSSGFTHHFRVHEGKDLRKDMEIYINIFVQYIEKYVTYIHIFANFCDFLSVNTNCINVLLPPNESTTCDKKPLRITWIHTRFSVIT